jgi:hypothetical protein
MKQEAQAGKRKIKVDECLKKISKDDVFSVKEWMEDLIAKSSEEGNV